MHQLEGNRSLVVGIANTDSIAYGCARAFRTAGAELAITYLNKRPSLTCGRLPSRWAAKTLSHAMYVKRGNSKPFSPGSPANMRRAPLRTAFDRLCTKRDLHLRVVDCSQAGFAVEMDVFCHALIRMAQLAEPLMRSGGCLLTVTFYGSETVVQQYSLIGPVKAAWEAGVRYMAAELGPQGIRVHACRPVIAVRFVLFFDKARLTRLQRRDRESTIIHAFYACGSAGCGRSLREKPCWKR